MGNFFSKHAISQEIADARPYRRYEQGDIEYANRVYDEYLVRKHGEVIVNSDTKRERRFLAKIVKQQPGVLIYRDAVGGFRPSSNPGAAIFPELRPDEPIATRPPQHHYHPTEWSRDEDGKRVWPAVPSGKNLPKSATSLAENLPKHIARSKAPDDHHGVNNEEVHTHQEYAKYVFLSGADHAKRLDVHPFALGLLPTASRVFFVLEGCIKADAVLTAILQRNQREAVISVPSVTLWDEQQFRVLATNYFQSREGTLPRPEIILVCDADWEENPMVFTQALLCRSMVRRLGYDAHISAPPRASGEKGVDDFLASGGTLDELEVLNREAPILGNPFDLRAKLAHHRKEKRSNCLRMLTALAEHSYDDEGNFSGSVEKLGKVSGTPKSTAYRAVEALIADQIIETDKPLILAKEIYVRNLGMVRNFDWEDRPVLTLPAHLRAEPFRFHRLINLHDQGGQIMDLMLRTLCDEITNLRQDNATLAERQDELETLVRDRFPAESEYPKIVERFISEALA